MYIFGHVVRYRAQEMLVDKRMLSSRTWLPAIHTLPSDNVPPKMAEDTLFAALQWLYQC